MKIFNFALTCSTGISCDTTFKAISLSDSMIFVPVMTNSGSINLTMGESSYMLRSINNR